MFRKQQSGFTLIELLVLLAFLAAIAVLIGGGYVLIHFISKYW